MRAIVKARVVAGALVVGVPKEIAEAFRLTGGDMVMVELRERHGREGNKAQRGLWVTLEGVAAVASATSNTKRKR